MVDSLSADEADREEEAEGKGCAGASGGYAHSNHGHPMLTGMAKGSSKGSKGGYGSAEAA